MSLGAGKCGGKSMDNLPSAIIGAIIILVIAGFIAFSYSTKTPPQTDTSHLDAAQVIDLEVQADKERAQAEATQ